MEATKRSQATGLEHVERLLARGFVLLGGVFWIAAAFAGPFVFAGVDLSESIRTALWPLIAAVVTLLVGWRYERLAAVLLLGAAVAVAVWGVLYEWEVGVWAIMVFALIAPMVCASALFVLAARAESRRALASGQV